MSPWWKYEFGKKYPKPERGFVNSLWRATVYSCIAAFVVGNVYLVSNLYYYMTYQQPARVQARKLMQRDLAAAEEEERSGIN